MPNETIPDAYPRAYSLVFDQSIQQTTSRFNNAGVVEQRWTGKEYVFRDLTQNNWVRNDARGGKTVARDSEFTHRKGYLKKIEAQAIEFPEWDKELLDNIVHPSSAEMTAMKAGYERALDDLCIEAMNEDVLTGPDPHITPLAFPASQVVPVNYVKPGVALGANSGLTPWKIIRAKNLFERLNLDLTKEEALLFMHPDDELNLRTYVETAGNETWARTIQSYFDKVDTGVSAKLMGIFNVIKTTRVATTTGGTVRLCGAFLRSGLIMSAPQQVKSSMDRIPDEKNKLLLQGSAMQGIVRRSDEKFVSIPCLIS